MLKTVYALLHFNYYIGKKMAIENKTIVKNLGKAAELFSDKGISFLRLRSNGTQGDIATKMIAALAKGSLKMPVKLNEEVSKEFNFTKLSPPMIAIIVLGRPPVRARAGGIQESGKVHDPKQLKAAQQIATAVKADLYANRVRKADTAKAEPAAPTTEKKPEAKKKVIAKKPTVKKATTGAKATVRKPAAKKTGTTNTAK